MVDAKEQTFKMILTIEQLQYLHTLISKEIDRLNISIKADPDIKDGDTSYIVTKKKKIYTDLLCEIELEQEIQENGS